jgi:nucleoid-associated protein YgaU
VGEEGTYPAQNPTTGAGPNVRVWTVRPGDRLDWIAHKEYGDSTRWRPIAEANGIDDPIDLKSGQQLVIPPR